MIEIGPNLKEIITNIFDEFRRNNPTCSGYIDFVKQIKELITLSPKAEIYEYKSDKKYPTKPGLYWYKGSNGNFTIVRFYYSGAIKVIGNDHIFSFDELQGKFVQPIEPLKEPVE